MFLFQCFMTNVDDILQARIGEFGHNGRRL